MIFSMLDGKKDIQSLREGDGKGHKTILYTIYDN